MECAEGGSGAGALDRCRRPRCTNFSAQEKNVLIHLVERHQPVLEGKRTDKASVHERERVWQGVAADFNQLVTAQPARTPRQLKMCYENLKRRVRKEGGVVVVTASAADGDSNGSTQAPTETAAVQPKEEAAHAGATGDSRRRRRASLARLRRSVLHKELHLLDLDAGVRAEKYELELQVLRAKLEYYRRKAALLPAPGAPSS